MKFVVKYNKNYDLKNYVDRIFSPRSVNYGGNIVETGSKYFPKEFLITIQDAATWQDAKIIVEDFWKDKRPKTFNQEIKIATEVFEKVLNDRQDLIIKPLENFYQRQFPFKRITVYLTTFFICPYQYPKWYMLNRNTNVVDAIGTSRHELNHFMFYYYFRKKLTNKLNIEKMEYLKESLSVSTSIKGIENQNKPNIWPIQEFIKKHKNKSADQIIDLVIASGLLK